MLKIYGRASSINVRKILWLADEMGLAYDREDWGRGYRSTSEPEFQKLSMFGVVPVVEDDGVVVRESNVILRYLASKHGREDLYPKDLAARAVVEMWMDWGAMDYGMGMRPLFQGKVNNNAPWNDPKLIAWGGEQWNIGSERLARYLEQNGPYVAGDAFTLGDIPVGLMLNRWFSIDFDKPDLPALNTYYDLLSQRPGFQAHGRNGLP